MNTDPGDLGGNVVNEPEQRFKLDAQQLAEVQSLDELAHRLRNMGQTDESIEAQLRDEYERAKAMAKLRSDTSMPTDGYEVAVAGVTIGSVPRTVTARRAMETLVDRGLVDPRDMGWFDGFAQTVKHVAAPATDHVGLSQQSQHLADSLREAESYLAQAEAAGRQVDGLRLLLLTTAYSASQDPRFRNSEVVDKIDAYQSRNS